MRATDVKTIALPGTQDTILVQIISGSLCAMRITIHGLNPEGLAQYFFWNWKAFVEAMQKPYLAKHFGTRYPAFPQQVSSTTKACLALQSTGERDSLPRGIHSLGGVNMRIGSLLVL